jgi:hypothetical protein
MALTRGYSPPAPVSDENKRTLKFDRIDVLHALGVEADAGQVIIGIDKEQLVTITIVTSISHG